MRLSYSGETILSFALVFTVVFDSCTNPLWACDPRVKVVYWPMRCGSDLPSLNQNRNSLICFFRGLGARVSGVGSVVLV
jgi:hypothetical protein